MSVLIRKRYAAYLPGPSSSSCWTSSFLPTSTGVDILSREPSTSAIGGVFRAHQSWPLTGLLIRETESQMPEDYKCFSISKQPSDTFTSVDDWSMPRMNRWMKVEGWMKMGGWRWTDEDGLMKKDGQGSINEEGWMKKDGWMKMKMKQDEGWIRMDRWRRVDGWRRIDERRRKDGWRMVPRRIMVFVFRLCLLGIILPSLWRENLTLRILFQLSRKMIKGRSPGQIFGES